MLRIFGFTGVSVVVWWRHEEIDCPVCNVVRGWLLKPRCQLDQDVKIAELERVNAEQREMLDNAAEMGRELVSLRQEHAKLRKQLKGARAIAGRVDIIQIDGPPAIKPAEFKELGEEILARDDMINSLKEQLRRARSVKPKK